MKASISKIKTFKACRRMYELKYIHDLEPVQTAEALETGKNYHSMIEALYKGERPAEDDYSKEAAMVAAYEKYIMPKVKIYPDGVELPFEMGWFNHQLVGRLDGIAADGALVEHKTTGTEITEEYEYDLAWDEQLLMYMYVTGKRKCYYTVCRKPTIRLKRGETEEEFFHRMVAWYDEDTDAKIRLLIVERSDVEVYQFATEMANILFEMDRCKNFYKNTLHCFRFGRRCEYAEICQHYDPNATYINFRKGGRVGNEGNEDTGAGEFF